MDTIDLCKQLNENGTILNMINKIFKILRNKIRITMHKNWLMNLLGTNPSVNGVPRVEIDESKIIVNSDRILWMFRMIDRLDKEAHVYCVMEDRTQNTIWDLRKYIYYKWWFGTWWNS